MTLCPKVPDDGHHAVSRNPFKVILLKFSVIYHRRGRRAYQCDQIGQFIGFWATF